MWLFSNAITHLPFVPPLSGFCNRGAQLVSLQHIKETPGPTTTSPQHSSASHSPTTNPYSPPPPPPTLPTLDSQGMAASAAYATQVSAGGYPHTHGYGSTSIHSTPLSLTLVDATRYTERPSIELKFSGSGAKIVNAFVADPAGRPLYSISSNSKRTKLLSHKDNIEVATVEWDRSSPRMVFRGKKVKCKDWLPLAGPDTE
jgi:hypothetical protein